jgi:hypothetical protein
VLRLIAVGILVAQAISHAQIPTTTWTANLNEIRSVSQVIPGRRPLRINFSKFAESRRTKNFSIKGAAADPSVQARTAFQVVYADGYVMVDAGMDQHVHRFFGRGVEEPFDPDAAARVDRALKGARLIMRGSNHHL